MLFILLRMWKAEPLPPQDVNRNSAPERLEVAQTFGRASTVIPAPSGAAYFLSR